MILATAGHVDHGKTALVRALTGQETDRTEAERRRGLTIELGYAWLELPDGASLDLVDVPGHARFMRTLVAGVGCVDGAMLVVAADDGLMPQTLEHLQLLALLEVPLALTVISKCSRVTPGQAEAVAGQVARCAEGLGLAACPVHYVDSLSGQGIEPLRQQLAHLARAPGKQSELSTRLLIDRHFVRDGIGQVVTGTLAQGGLSAGDRLVLSAGGGSVRVRGLQIHGRPVSAVRAGQRCALNLTGELPERIERGAQLLDPEVYQPTSRIDLLLGDPLGPLPRSLQLHLGGAVINARLVPLRIPLGDIPGTAMQAVLAEPLCCRLGDRLVLRDPASQRLIAGGRVLDPFPPQRGRHQPERAQLLAALLEPDPASQLRRLLETLPGMLDLDWYRRATHLASAELQAGLEQIEQDQGLLRIGSRVCPATRVDALRDRLVQEVASWHQQQPTRPGIPAPLLARQLALSPQDPLLRLALRRALNGAAGTNALAQHGALLALPGFVPRPDPETAAWLAQLMPAFAAAAPRPPVLGDMMQGLGLSREALVDRLERLVGQGQLVRVGRNRYLTQDSLQVLCDVARQLTESSEGSGFTTAAFRDASGVGRNHSVAILECLDRLGLTRRLADERRVAL